MPPIRTFPTVKPIKTERTHEENQERAYIAASRRSDRSLEARVESARRASEIHKRRTGRSLRVTEQDVVNEEMYEEEDDDLPAQYRRLTAQLNTGSADFNRRLSAYLSNHVAMRNALGQALSNSYQQYPNGTPWAQNMAKLQDQPFNTTPGQMDPNNPSMPSQMMHSPSAPFHQSPYNSANSQALRPPYDHRSTSSSSAIQDGVNGADASVNQIRPKHSRRASEPVHAATDATLEPSTIDFSKSSSASPSVEKKKPSGRDANLPLHSIQEDMQNSNDSHQSALPTPSSLPPSGTSEPYNLGPLSTTLPPETQMFTNAFFDSSDPFANRMWSHNEKNNIYLNEANTNSAIKHPALQGMNQTLAPSVLETNHDNMSWGMSGNDMNAPFSAPPFTYNFDSAFSDSFSKSGMFSDDQRSGQLTPTDKDWTSFIDSSSWDDTTS